MSELEKAVEDAVPAPPPQPLRVTKILIEGLFRRYDHLIELRQKERVTILHGKNGVGKTIALEMIEALLKGNAEHLRQAPFRRMRVDFGDQSWIELNRSEPEASQEHILWANSEVDTFTSTPVEKYKERKGKASDFGVGMKPARLELTWRVKEGQPRTATYTGNSADANPGSSWTDLSADLLDRSPVDYIKTNRLEEMKEVFELSEHLNGYVSETSQMAIPSVILMAEDMMNRMRVMDARYSRLAKELDDSLPKRLFGRGPRDSLPVETLKARYDALAKERVRLQDIGILQGSAQDFDLASLETERERAMFAVYLDDNEKKLRVFQGVSRRAELLLQWMNSKLAPKKIVLDKKDGYRLFTHDQRQLGLEQLSSGEQHELVLLHTLLFKVKPGTLLLIDEPELSLHLVWQKELLSDLLKIAELAKIDIVLATHSPYIVGERRDLLVQLGAPE